MKLADHLRTRRIECGLSIMQAAVRSGITRAHLSDMERGKRTGANLTTIRALAGTYATTVSELIGESSPQLNARERAVIAAMRTPNNR